MGGRSIQWLTRTPLGKMLTLTSFGQFLLPIGYYTQTAHSPAPCWDPLHPPNTYRSACNPHYWKNRKPYPSYWQQDVYYQINATLNTDSHWIDGQLTLIYWNNSPDTLHFVYFHLYQNAFQPGSYYSDLVRAQRIPHQFGKYEQRKLGTIVNNLRVNGTTPPRIIIDNTLMRIDLPQALYPGDSATFTMRFRTYFDDGGTLRRRMKMYDIWMRRPNGELYKAKHYNVVHWYPRISVYDRRFGWTTDQHLDKEFYGDFGTFNVRITLPACYIVEATGFLLNRDEVLPDSLFQKLQLDRFRNKPWGEPNDEIIPCNEKTKTWWFYAENVHDFAWTASPAYRIDTASWNGIQCIALAEENHARGWQNVAEFTCRVVRTYVQDFGPYIWHKIVVADARDGMEYPMITLCTGAEPGNYGLIAHEVGHMWFFGHIGNNETYRAFLDEGFTQFLTAWALEKNGYRIQAWGTPFQRKFRTPLYARDLRIYLGYLRDAQWGQDVPIAQHSTYFHNAYRHGGGYRHVYYKTAAMLGHLRYILGDSLFLHAMQHYYRKWYLCHPYEEDFRYALREATHMDLNLLLDAYLYSIQWLDYRITSLQQRRLPNGQYAVKIRLKRQGTMSSPLHLYLFRQDSLIRHWYIPDHWGSARPDLSARTAKPWYGWGEWFRRRYTLTDTLHLRITRATLDTGYWMPDVYFPDNHRPRARHLTWDIGVSPLPTWRHQTILIRPALWLNAADGWQTGIALRSTYMGYRSEWWLRLRFAWRWALPSIIPTTPFRKGAYPNDQVFPPSSRPGLPVNGWFQWQYPLARWLPESRLRLSVIAQHGALATKLGYRFRLKHPYVRDHHWIELALVNWYFHATAPYRWQPWLWTLPERLWQVLAGASWSAHWRIPVRGQTASSHLHIYSSLWTQPYAYTRLWMVHQWRWSLPQVLMEAQWRTGWLWGTRPLAFFAFGASSGPWRWWLDPLAGAPGWLPPPTPDPTTLPRLVGYRVPGDFNFFSLSADGPRLLTGATTGSVQIELFRWARRWLPRWRTGKLRLFAYAQGGWIQEYGTPPGYLTGVWESGLGMQVQVWQIGAFNGIAPVKLNTWLVITGSEVRLGTPVLFWSLQFTRLPDLW